jgi:hypothetical protein
MTFNELSDHIGIIEVDANVNFITSEHDDRKREAATIMLAARTTREVLPAHMLEEGVLEKDTVDVVKFADHVLLTPNKNSVISERITEARRSLARKIGTFNTVASTYVEMDVKRILLELLDNEQRKAA